MNTFKVTYTDGGSYQTSANGTLKQFTDYLMQDGGVYVDENQVTGVETRHQIVKVEMVKELVIHVRETNRDPVYGPIYEGWVQGVNCEAANLLGELANTHCAMSVNQADVYVGKCLLAAADYQDKDLQAPDGSIYRALVEVETQYE